MSEEEQLILKVRKIHPDAIIPRYAHEDDAAMDLFSLEDYIIVEGERKLVRTGLSVEVPKGYEMQIRPRSGLAIKHGITILNSPGTIDSGYRGEVGVILINHSVESYNINKGERIAQAKISKVEKIAIIESEKLSESSRGDGGFGSTGL